MVNVIVSVDANTFFSVEKLWENHGKPMLIMMIMLITMGKTHYEYYEIVISFSTVRKMSLVGHHCFSTFGSFQFLQRCLLYVIIIFFQKSYAFR